MWVGHVCEIYFHELVVSRSLIKYSVHPMVSACIEYMAGYSNFGCPWPC